MSSGVEAFLDLRYYVYYTADDLVFYRRVYKTKESAIRFVKSLKGTIYHVSDIINFTEVTSNE